MSVNQTERRIVRRVIRELAKAGYKPEQVWNSEEYVPATTERAVLAAVFAVDDATVHFRATDPALEAAYSHGVYFVLGNGIDVLSDWHCDDRKFDAVLRSVCDYVHELEEQQS